MAKLGGIKTKSGWYAKEPMVFSKEVFNVVLEIISPSSK